MDKKSTLVKVRAKIDCPVCCSDNYFDLSANEVKLTCDDCGFELITDEGTPFDILTQESQCPFCKCTKFHREYRFIEFLFGKRIFCYLCEAKFAGWEYPSADPSFVQKTRDLIEKSDEAARLKKRIGQYLETPSL